jgi:hypothetical protein
MKLIPALLLLGIWAGAPVEVHAAGCPLAGAAAGPEMTPQEFDKRRAALLDSMKKMQAQMEAIQRTKDPKDRDKLLREHWQSMQDAMSALNETWGSSMMGGCPMNGTGMHAGMMPGRGMMMWGNYQQLTPEQLKQRQYMLDQWLPMHQLMMEQMLQHQHWMMAPPQLPADRK